MNGWCHPECIKVKVIKQTKICLFLFLFRKVRWRTTMHFTITVQYPSIRATKCSRIENALGITLRNLLTTCDDNEHRAPPIFIKYFTLQLKTHSENSCKRMSKVCQLRPNHQKTKIWISFPGIKTKHRNSKFESPTRKGYIYALALSPFTVNTNCIVHRIHRPHSSTPAYVWRIFNKWMHYKGHSTWPAGMIWIFWNVWVCAVWAIFTKSIIGTMFVLRYAICTATAQQ